MTSCFTEIAKVNKLPIHETFGSEVAKLQSGTERNFSTCTLTS